MQNTPTAQRTDDFLRSEAVLHPVNENSATALHSGDSIPARTDEHANRNTKTTTTFILSIPYFGNLMSVSVRTDVDVSPRRWNISLDPVEPAQIRVDFIGLETRRSRRHAEVILPE